MASAVIVLTYKSELSQMLLRFVASVSNSILFMRCPLHIFSER